MIPKHSPPPVTFQNILHSLQVLEQTYNNKINKSCKRHIPILEIEGIHPANRIDIIPFSRHRLNFEFWFFKKVLCQS